VIICVRFYAHHLNRSDPNNLIQKSVELKRRQNATAREGGARSPEKWKRREERVMGKDRMQ
jgi:hypothetical protein